MLGELNRIILAQKDEIATLKVSLINYFTAAEFKNVEEMVEGKPPEFYRMMGKVVAERTKELHALKERVTYLRKGWDAEQAQWLEKSKENDALTQRVKDLEAKYENHDNEWVKSSLYFDLYAKCKKYREALEKIHTLSRDCDIYPPNMNDVLDRIVDIAREAIEPFLALPTDDDLAFKGLPGVTLNEGRPIRKEE